LPVSRCIVSATLSWLSSSQSRSWPIQRARPLIPSSSQAGWFARTRATVAATSAASSSATLAITEPSAGLVTSKLSREALVDAAAVSMAMRVLSLSGGGSGL
jgi:hypothetical protein